MMKTTTEVEIKVSDGREYDEDIFALVEASKLSLDDEFMTHKPKTHNEKEFKKLLTEAIKSGLNDFYRPTMDPTVTLDIHGNMCIYYAKGRRVFHGKSYNWWEKKAKEFMPERGSRLGTKGEYVAFLGDLIKKLVAIGWTVDKAWDDICNNSKNFGSCNDITGSNEIAGYYDLYGSISKILAAYDEVVDGNIASRYITDDSFWVADFWIDGDNLSTINLKTSLNANFQYAVGWLVLEK